MAKLSSVRMPESPPFLSPCYRQKQKVELFKRIAHSAEKATCFPTLGWRCFWAEPFMFSSRYTYPLFPDKFNISGSVKRPMSLNDAN
jgi:hypothetical protein